MIDRRRYNTVLPSTDNKRQPTILRLEIDIHQSPSEEVTERVLFKKLSNCGPVNCPTQGCHYFSTHKGMYDRHVKQCDGKTKLNCHQKIYKNINHDIFYKELIDEKILKADYSPKHATVYWDAETFMQKNDEKITAKTTDVADHKLTMICYYPINCNDFEPKSYVIEREQDGPEGLRKIVSDFFDALRLISDAHIASLGELFLKGFRKYRDIVTNYTNIIRLSAEDQQKARVKYRILKTLHDVHVISFNGERYDHKIVVRELIDHVYDLDFSGPLWKNQHVIKRGAGYMMLAFDNIIFKDALNYTIPCSLQNFANSVGIKDNSKEIFPYEKFSKRSDAENCEQFPPYNEFKSSLWIPSKKYVEELNQMIRDGRWEYVYCLKTDLGLTWKEVRRLSQSKTVSCFPINEETMRFFNIPIEKYIQSKKKYERMKNEGEIFNLWDWLILYNQIDVELLKDAFESYTKLVLKEFGLDTYQFVSLSAISQHVAYTKYDATTPPLYSFPQKFKSFSELLRSKMRGGICMVFHRMISLNNTDENLPEAARTAPNGCTWKKLIQWDCNSL